VLHNPVTQKDWTYVCHSVNDEERTVTETDTARWIWGPQGWLKELGVIDNSGCGVVHEMGGFAGTFIRNNIPIQHLGVGLKKA
jgi:hypothetical protein